MNQALFLKSALQLYIKKYNKEKNKPNLSKTSSCGNITSQIYFTVCEPY